MPFPSLSFCWLLVFSKGAGQAYVYMKNSFISAVLKIGLEIGQSFIETRNISLDSPLEMYSKSVLAYQFWSAKS